LQPKIHKPVNDEPRDFFSAENDMRSGGDYHGCLRDPVFHSVCGMPVGGAIKEKKTRDREKKIFGQIVG